MQDTEIARVLGDEYTLVWLVPDEVSLKHRESTPDEVFRVILGQTYRPNEFRLVELEGARELYAAALADTVARLPARTEPKVVDPERCILEVRSDDGSERLLRHLRIALLARPTMN